MKIVAVLFVVFAALTSGAFVATMNLATPDTTLATQQGAAQTDKNVVLYATAWCGYCKKMRAFFDAHNIPYVEFDIDNSQEGLDRYYSVGGTGGVPLVTVNDTVVKGFNPSRVLQLMQN
ncbi:MULTISPECIES: glutaredoxin family protein [Thalassolituus]|jgi:glutaredoxin|uniref:glutaredoxin family protein n=1 Tax=Thalassolituus TaxID=187492 RepID=UPI0023F1CD59|nr:glutaredoxin family protein [Thalassolituus oleivorans]